MGSRAKSTHETAERFPGRTCREGEIMPTPDAELGSVDPLGVISISELCRSVFGSIARSGQRRWGKLYVRGPVTPPGRKPIRRMADLASGSRSVQTLQQFVNQSLREWSPVRAALANLVSRALRPKA